LLNTLSEEELAKAFWELADEPANQEIARQVVIQRAVQAITQTSQLVQVVFDAKGINQKAWHQQRRTEKVTSLHPAARTFQALRILINDELGCLREQVRVLVEQQEKQDKRIRLSNSQRMRVAAKAKRLSRKMLEQCTELFTPDTVMRWYRKLIAEKYDGSQNRTYAGRPQIPQEIVDLVIRFKEENPRWGYKKIRDQVVYLGYTICKAGVKNILIETARKNYMTCKKIHGNGPI